MSDLSYSDSSAPSEAQSGDAAPDEQDADNSALLPKSLLNGKTCKPGDEIILRIEEIYDDEFSVSPVKEKSKPSEEMTGMEEAQSGLDKYAT